MHLKREEKGTVLGISIAGWRSSVSKARCFPYHFLVQIFLILETSGMQVMISESPGQIRFIVI
jgi:hypothetical protein